MAEKYGVLCGGKKKQVKSMDVKLGETLLCQYFLPSSALIWESGACEAVAWSGSDILRGLGNKVGPDGYGCELRGSSSSPCPVPWVCVVWRGEPFCRLAGDREGD